MVMTKVHILDGHGSHGKPYTACGRWLAIRPWEKLQRSLVGRAHIVKGERWHDVTCAGCRRKYGLDK